MGGGGKYRFCQKSRNDANSRVRGVMFFASLWHTVHTKIDMWLTPKSTEYWNGKIQYDKSFYKNYKKKLNNKVAKNIEAEAKERDVLLWISLIRAFRLLYNVSSIVILEVVFSLLLLFREGDIFLPNFCKSSYK